MEVELVVPRALEGRRGLRVSAWLAREGDRVRAGDPVVLVVVGGEPSQIEAPADGVLAQVLKTEGEDVEAGEVLGVLHGAAEERREAAAPTRGSGASQASEAGPTHRLRDLLGAPESADGAPRSEARGPQPPAAVGAAPGLAFEEVDLTGFVRMRDEHGEAFTERHGVALTTLPFYARGVVAALREVPGLNAEVRGDRAVRRERVHLAFEVRGQGGLVAPVVRDVDAHPLPALAVALDEMLARARKGRMRASETRGGTLTLCDAASYGSLLGTPRIRAPQAAGLAVHEPEDRAVVRDGGVVVRPMAWMVLAYDPAAADAQDAVRFLARLRRAVEEPARLLLEI